MSYNSNEALQQQDKSYEIYHFSTDDDDGDWYYTSNDSDVDVGGHTYTHVAIKRSGYIKELSPTVPTISITAPITVPFSNYLVATPLLPITVEITKYFDDGSSGLIFIGKVKDISFEKNVASVRCVMKNNVLKNIIPRTKFQSYCNNDFCDDACGLDVADYTKSGCVITGVSGIELTSDDFAEDANWGGDFTNGYVKFGSDRRFIAKHDEANKKIYLQFAFDGIEATDTVDLVMGCDKSPATCKAFPKSEHVSSVDNFEHFQGFPYMPFNNPALG